MSLVLDIAATYRGPRRVIRRLTAGPEQESRALMYLMVACGLIFVAQWPRLRREAFLDSAQAVPFDARLGGALLAWIFLVPLAMYAIAWVSRGIARVMGGRGTGYTARLALFWSLLAATPLWLFYGLLAGFSGPGPSLTFAGLVAFAVFLLFWVLSMIETERR